MLRRILAQVISLSLVVIGLLPLSNPAIAERRQDGPGNKQKLALDLKGRRSTSKRLVRVIIQTKGRPSGVHLNLLAMRGGIARRTFKAFDALVAEVPEDALEELAKREDIAYISPDRPIRADLELTRETTGAAQVQAQSASGAPGLTGRGVTIAIIDSGISAAHPDFDNRIIAAVDFTGSPRHGDFDGHGTGVASVAAGSGAASRGYAGNYAGIAPGANLVDLRVLDEHGTGQTSGVLQAIEWAIQNRERYKIRVINMSLSTPVQESYETDPLCQAVERAVRAGIVVVCSAGNRGRTEEILGYDAQGNPIYRLVYGGIGSPGNSPFAITVGATDSHATVTRKDDTVASFSSKGPTMYDHIVKPDIVAPGRRIVAAMSQEPGATIPTEYPDRIQQPTSDGVPNMYFTYSGTSFAAPVVAGAVALMLEANGSLTPALVKAALMRTAQLLPGQSFANAALSAVTQGAGLINIPGAVKMAQAINPRANELRAGDPIFRGEMTLHDFGGGNTVAGEYASFNANLIYASGVLFSARPILCNGIMLADHLLPANNWLMVNRDGIMLADGVVLGDGIMLADGVVLGDGIMLADGVVLGDGIMLADGVVLGDGIMLADGVVLGDGIMLADGVVLGDGIMLADGVVLGDGIMLADGVVLGD